MSNSVATASNGGSTGVKRKAPAPRKASPTRQGTNNDAEEMTFNEKLAEIKKMRSTGERSNNVPLVHRSNRGEEPVVPKQVKTATGVKTFLKTFENWIEVVSGSGKIYYYNKKNRENQWKKPQAWIDEEMRLNPPIPPEPELPPVPLMPEEIPLPEPLVSTVAPAVTVKKKPEPPKLTMKIKAKKKVNKLKKKESKLPTAYQSNRPDVNSDDSDPDTTVDNKITVPVEKKGKLAIDNVFESVDEDKKPQQLQKVEKQEGDEIVQFGQLKPVVVSSDVTENGTKLATDSIKEEKEGLKNGGDATAADKNAANTAVVKAEDQKVKVEKLNLDELTRSGRERIRKKGSAAEQAYQNLSKLPESTLMYGDAMLATSNPPPGSMLAGMSGESVAKMTGNITFFTDYNIPCCLRNCKFPKEQDVLNELKINKLKKRNYHPQAKYDNPELERMAREAEMEQFYIELKNYNNHDRLLTSRLDGTLCYKIVDEIWDRYFHLFQIKILDGVYLECRPSGYSHKDELILSRTGKNCGYKTFPEDLVRCQGILQAWKKDYCLVVYANKIFKVERDNRDWKRDLEEVRRFLERKGY